MITLVKIQAVITTMTIKVRRNQQNSKPSQITAAMHKSQVTHQSKKIQK